MQLQNSITTISAEEADRIRETNDYEVIITNQCLFTKRPNKINHSTWSLGLSYLLREYLANHQMLYDYNGNTRKQNDTFIVAMNDLGYLMERIDNSPFYKMNVTVNSAPLAHANGLNNYSPATQIELAKYTPGMTPKIFQKLDEIQGALSFNKSNPQFVDYDY